MSHSFDGSLRSLEVFLAVADQGGFAPAAHWLGISQPSVSAQIAKLERRVGTSLFVRESGKRAQLTSAGQKLVTHARGLLGGATALASEFEREVRTMASEVRVSCQRLLAHSVLPKAFATFMTEHPEVSLIQSSGTVDDILKSISSHQADLGLYLNFSSPCPEAAFRIGKIDFKFAVAPSHPLARGVQPVSPVELEKFGFIEAAHHSSFVGEVQEMLSRSGIHRLKTTARASDSNVARELSAAGVGIICVPLAAIEGDLTSGKLFQVNVEGVELTMDLIALTTASRPANLGIHALLTHLAQHTPLSAHKLRKAKF